MVNRGNSVQGLNGNAVQSRAPAQKQSLRRDRVGSRQDSRRTTPDDIGGKRRKGPSEAQRAASLILGFDREIAALKRMRLQLARLVARRS